MQPNPFRAIPSTDELGRMFEGRALQGEALTTFLHAQQQLIRERLAAGDQLDRAAMLDMIETALRSLDKPRLRPIINATGVVLHTNLGRAPVSDETAEAMAVAASGYVSLELEAESGRRGGRMSEISALMRLLTGAEATLVVNNNAAAILLTLAALSAGREAIVSRGEAVEIGGGFRIPDVMRQSGAVLLEVGTTNRTYPSDYERAVTPNTALFLKVHASNFQMTGFTTSTSIAELAPVSRRTQVPIVEDLGSGSLIDGSSFGLRHEPTIGESIAAGAAVVTASGDKLLGGPQAGIIAGRADLIAQIERHPLARAVRADKSCLAGIAATLRHYARGDALSRIPIWRMIATSSEELKSRAEALSAHLAPDVRLDVRSTASTIGGGAHPGQTQPSFALALKSNAVDEAARALRTGALGIYGRIADGDLLLDLRTVLPEDDDRLAQAIGESLSRGGRHPEWSSYESPGSTD